MRLRDLSLRQDPDLRQELASLARGCDFVLPSRFKKRLKAFQQVQARKEEPLPPASSQSIPAFYFPRGRPQDTVNVDAVIAKIEKTFAQFPHERATMEDMGRVAKACGCPLYWKGPLFCGAGGERTGSVSVHKFVAMWRKVLHSCHDDAAKFVHLLMNPGCNYLVQEDFIPFLQDVVNTHPGLAFLKEASEFHSRYITTVIQRIFYTVNRSWSGRITCAELRRSTFLQNVALLEEEADINQLTEFFSYEHFYVIYCKFWELDTDHDLRIDARDLARHNDHGEYASPGGGDTGPAPSGDTSVAASPSLQNWRSVLLSGHLLQPSPSRTLSLQDTRGTGAHTGHVGSRADMEHRAGREQSGADTERMQDTWDRCRHGAAWEQARRGKYDRTREDSVDTGHTTARADRPVCGRTCWAKQLRAPYRGCSGPRSGGTGCGRAVTAQEPCPGAGEWSCQRALARPLPAARELSWLWAQEPGRGFRASLQLQLGQVTVSTLLREVTTPASRAQRAGGLRVRSAMQLHMRGSPPGGAFAWTCASLCHSFTTGAFLDSRHVPYLWLVWPRRLLPVSLGLALQGSRG
uniref:Serine/threonine-protein phosphatase 2A regulatory subunit B'' subunit beta n=1 Tax=Catagonus wagneri TaxID=51154 RepID=A0A8C3VZ31_9CETA